MQPTPRRHGSLFRSLRSRAVVFAALIVGFPLLILAAQSQPPARSQGSEHRVRVALYHSVIEWPAPPGDFGAHVTVADSIGEKADGTGSSGPDGIIRVQLRINRGGRGEPWPDHHLAPGDRVSLERSDGVTVSLILPELSADVTDDGLTIVGTAPPSAALSLYQEPVPSGLPAPPAVDITAGPDGRFEHVLAPEHARTPGTGGYVEYSNADGDFTAHFASREVAIVLDSTRVEHRRTLQTVLKITRPVTLSGGKRVLRSITGSRAPTTVGPDGRGVLDDLPKYPLVAGLPVTVSLTGGPLGRSDDTRLTLPDLRVVFDGAARMSGNGPAEVPLRLDLFAPDQPSPSFTVEVRPEADGTFIAELPEPVRTTAGWRATLSMGFGQGVEVRSWAVRPRILMAVGTASLHVDVMPSKRVTATLHNEAGEILGSDAKTVSIDGRFTLDLDRPDPDIAGGVDTPMYPGSILAVEIARSDPIRIEVPRLSTGLDVDARVLRVRGPTAVDIQALITDGSSILKRLLSTDAAAGEAEWRLPDSLDLVSGRTWAAITLTLPSGHAAVAEAAPLTLAVLTGHGGQVNYISDIMTGKALTVTLSDTSGGLVHQEIIQASTARRTGPLFGIFQYLPLRDALDASVPIWSGDVVQVSRGLESARMTVPVVTARVNVAERLVAGSTIPNANLTFMKHPEYAPSTREYGRSDERGMFRHVLEEIEIGANDGLFVSVGLGRHEAWFPIGAPGMVVEVDTGLVIGAVEPNVGVRVELVRDGAVVAAGIGRTNDHAEFTIPLIGSDGRRGAVKPGDQVLVSAPEAELTRELSWRVPEFTVAIEPDGRGMGGMAPFKGGTIWLSQLFSVSFPLMDRGRLESSRTEIGPDDTWRTRFLDPTSGSGYRAHLISNSGNIAIRDAVEPLLVVEHGGDRVCGAGHPLLPVIIERTAEDGTVDARATTYSNERGAFEAEMLTDDGLPVHLVSGSRLSATIGGRTLAMTVPVLSGRFDPEVLSLRLDPLPPEADVALAYGARTCLHALPWSRAFAELERTGRFRRIAADFTNPDGSLMRNAFTALERPQMTHGAEISVLRDEWRIYKSVPAPLRGEGYVGTDRVIGFARPRSSVTVSLMNADRSVRASSTPATDRYGAFDTQLERADGSPGVIRSGDLIGLSTQDGPNETFAAEPESAEFAVETLGFDRDGEGGILGTAPAGRTVRIELDIDDVQVIIVEREAGPDGRFAFGPSDVPPRSKWKIDDVLAIRVILVQDGWHATASEWRRETERKPAYLPWAGNGR